MRIKRTGGGVTTPDPDPKAGFAHTAVTQMRLALTAEGAPVYRKVIPVTVRRRIRAPAVA